jgi:hypothetical protein
MRFPYPQLYLSPDDNGGGSPTADPPAPAPTPDPQAPDSGPPSSVPYDRFKEVNDKRKQLEAQLADFEKAAKEAKEKELAEQKKFQELAEQYKNELESERLNRLRLEVATRHNLPLDLATRLQGKDADELAADAAKLAELVKPAAPGVPPAPGRSGPTAGFTREQLSDPAFIRENAEKIMDAARRGELPTS